MIRGFHPKGLTQHESDNQSGNNVVTHALLEMGKILALLMQEHNKVNTGEKAQGNPLGSKALPLQEMLQKVCKID